MTIVSPLKAGMIFVWQARRYLNKKWEYNKYWGSFLPTASNLVDCFSLFAPNASSSFDETFTKQVPHLQLPPQKARNHDKKDDFYNE